MKVWEIIRAVEEDEITAISYDGVSDVHYRTSTGWEFELFMDCGEPDYINWVKAPNDPARLELWSRREGKAADAVRYLAGNIVALVSDKLLAAAKTLPNWDY